MIATKNDEMIVRVKIVFLAATTIAVLIMGSCHRKTWIYIG